MNLKLNIKQIEYFNKFVCLVKMILIFFNFNLFFYYALYILEPKMYMIYEYIILTSFHIRNRKNFFDFRLKNHNLI